MKTELYIEKDCIFTHEGKTFSSGGAYVAPNYLIAYPAKDGALHNWHGKILGSWRAVSSWLVRSYYGPRMYQIEATVNGITYTGRGFGEGMLFRGRAKKSRK